MEGMLTDGQKNLLKEASARRGLRYVIDVESFGGLGYAPYSSAVRDLAAALGGEEEAGRCISGIVDAGLVTRRKDVYSVGIPLAGNSGELKRVVVADILTLNKLPDGAKLEIGRLLYG
jgi:hypothetical protein